MKSLTEDRTKPGTAPSRGCHWLQKTDNTEDYSRTTITNQLIQKTELIVIQLHWKWQAKNLKFHVTTTNSTFIWLSCPPPNELFNYKRLREMILNLMKLSRHKHVSAPKRCFTNSSYFLDSMQFSIDFWMCIFLVNSIVFCFFIFVHLKSFFCMFYHCFSFFLIFSHFKSF